MPKKQSVSGPFWTKGSKTPNIVARNCGVRAYPDNRPEVIEKIKAKIEEQGFCQQLYGREFIERSYVLARDSKELFRVEVNNYDCASGDFYFDPNLKLYWRDTGSFD